MGRWDRWRFYWIWATSEFRRHPLGYLGIVALTIGIIAFLVSPAFWIGTPNEYKANITRISREVQDDFDVHRPWVILNARLSDGRFVVVRTPPSPRIFNVGEEVTLIERRNTLLQLTSYRLKYKRKEPE